MSKQTKVRPMLLAASTAGVAILGAWYGAGLKQDQEIKKKAGSRKEATPAEKIAILEQTKSGLVAKKSALEIKIAQLESRGLDTQDGEKAQGRPF